MNDRPWYRDGLRFTCTACGDCCSGNPGAVWLNDDEIAAMAGELAITVAKFESRHVRVLSGRRSLREHPGGDCVLFESDSRRCSVYASRPTQCRTWPFWQAQVDSPAAWQTVCAECPGAQEPGGSEGELVDETEIRRRLAQLAAARR